MKLDTRHVPVLLSQVLQIVAPRSGNVIVDCTLGLGGHAGALLERSPGLAVPPTFGPVRLRVPAGGRVLGHEGKVKDDRLPWADFAAGAGSPDED